MAKLVIGNMLKASILEGNLQAIKEQLAPGVKLNKRIDGKPPLVLAIESGHEEIAVALIEHGASFSLPPFKPILNEQRETTGLFKSICGAVVVFILDWVLSNVLHTINRIYAPGPIIEGFTNGNRLGVVCQTGMACLIGSIFTDSAKGFLETSLEWILFELLLMMMAASRSTHLQVFAAWCLQPTLAATATRELMRSIWCRRLKCKSLQAFLYLFPPPDHQGIDVLDALLAYRGGTDSVATTLLDLGIFSQAYIKASLAFPNAYPAKVIWWAADRGFYRPVQRLLELGFPPDYIRRFHNSLSEVSADKGHVGVLQALLMHGGSVNGPSLSQEEQRDPLLRHNSYPPIVRSASSLLNSISIDQKEGLRECIRLLLKKGADPNLRKDSDRTALSLAAQADDEVVTMLLDNGARPNIADRYGRLPLHFSSCTPAIIRALVNGGLDINATDMDGNTALHSTSRNEENVDGLRILLEAQADPHLVNKSGETAFQIVARYGDKEVLSLFLEAGSDVNAHANGSRPPILLACLRNFGKAGIIQYLLSKGADPNVSDGRGMTALHSLCTWNVSSRSDYDDHISAIKALILEGADVNARKEDSNGVKAVTPIGLAAAHVASTEVIKLLLHAGAEPDGLSDEGKPALIACIMEKSAWRAKEVVSILDTFLDHSPATIHQEDREGLTPLYWAFETKNYLACQRLILLGADISVMY
ncbi:hypothetical protein IL306_013948 [Fusarium sp. DS 682]|nr:hypothetical protein IL306_013948 [Fusarium sp. DS 682]